jgi:hypothetical protein
MFGLSAATPYKGKAAGKELTPRPVPRIASSIFRSAEFLRPSPLFNQGRSRQHATGEHDENFNPREARPKYSVCAFALDARHIQDAL